MEEVYKEFDRAIVDERSEDGDLEDSNDDDQSYWKQCILI